MYSKVLQFRFFIRTEKLIYPNLVMDSIQLLHLDVADSCINLEVRSPFSGSDARVQLCIAPSIQSIIITFTEWPFYNSFCLCIDSGTINGEGHCRYRGNNRCDRNLVLHYFPAFALSFKSPPPTITLRSLSWSILTLQLKAKWKRSCEWNRRNHDKLQARFCLEDIFCSCITLPVFPESSWSSPSPFLLGIPQWRMYFRCIYNKKRYVCLPIIVHAEGGYMQARTTWA